MLFFLFPLFFPIFFTFFVPLNEKKSMKQIINTGWWRNSQLKTGGWA